ncbi:MAG: PorV/PorQ family protein [Elusimicrobia bacterium]|nr:PorV/PorQ family protein [Elusimicrobiota bacterium]
MKKTAILAACLGLSSPAVQAYKNRVATNAAEFLRVGAGARALGMAEAYSAVAEGAEAIYWNPAGLAQMRRTAIHYSRSEMLDYFHHDFAAYVQPVPSLGGAIGASLTRLSQAKLPLVTAANENVGSFSPLSLSAGLGYATAFTVNSDRSSPGRVLAGLALKAIHERYYQRQATAIAADGGVLFRPPGLKLNLGLALRNLGQKIRFIEDRENLPTEIALGVSYDKSTPVSRWMPAAELVLPYAGGSFAKIGLEHTRALGPDLAGALRIGYKTQTVSELGALSGLTCGLGGRWRRFRADLGFQPMGQLGEVYRLTLGFFW